MEYRTTGYHERLALREGSLTLTKKQRTLLQTAGHQRLERRPISADAFDALVQLGFLGENGKITIEGARALRVLNNQEE